MVFKRLAYRFLHTLFENHFIGAEDFLIPCCGHTMLPSDDNNSVSIIGCNNGIDFSIIHSQEIVSVITANHIEYQVSFFDYKNAIISFSKQIISFYEANPPRKTDNAFDKVGYRAFIAEFHSLYNKANALSDNISKISIISFDDYSCYSEDDITGISNEGISLNSFVL